MILSLALLAAAFDVVALVDSLDFAEWYDIEKTEGNLQVLEHVLKTSATDIWWRDKGGGRLRYPSKEEAYPLSEFPFDRHIVPCEDVYGHLRLDRPEANPFPLVRRECARRGIGFGLHTAWEETHYNLISLTSSWTLNHPQFWCCENGRKPFLATCSVAYPEVVAHKLRLVDERLALGPGTIFLDLTRDGSWSVVREFVKPMTDEWRRRYGCAPPTTNDVRWTALVSEPVTAYLKQFAARCHAKGCRFVLGLRDMEYVGSTYRRYGIDWRKLAADGTIDAVVAMWFAYDRTNAWNSIEAVYREVMSERGKADVYFPLSSYNCGGVGYPNLARTLGISEAEAVRRLLCLAKDVGARGVVMECVDYGNYSPAVCEEIRRFLESL